VPPFLAKKWRRSWQQLDFLRRLDCDVIQRFLISRPLPVVEINRFLVRGRQMLDFAQINVR
jgi:hypothetical protein